MSPCGMELITGYSSNCIILFSVLTLADGLTGLICSFYHSTKEDRIFTFEIFLADMCDSIAYSLFLMAKEHIFCFY